MEVQTQHHSSNLIIFNNRNGKEKEQYLSLQSQTGDFLNQTNMLFNNGGSNQRTHQSPQVIDLSLLHKPNHPSLNMVHTGLRLSSSEDQTQKISQHLNFFSSSSECYNRESEEVDGFLHAQAEELRRMLAERRNVNYEALLSAVDEPSVRQLKEKEAEIERATRFHNELVARDAQLRAETQAWQARANAQEATAMALQAQFHYAANKCRESAKDSRAAEGGLLCAATGTSGLENAESAYVDPERIRRPRCKVCRNREATVVVLPCWHLSICPECDRTALACPLCLTLLAKFKPISLSSLYIVET